MTGSRSSKSKYFTESSMADVTEHVISFLNGNLVDKIENLLN